jgi:ATP synthase protein I
VLVVVSVLSRYEVLNDERGVVPFQALNHDEAHALRQRIASVSPWHVVFVQALVGVVCVLLIWLTTSRASAGWSAAYGATAAVIPSALLARGMTKAVFQFPGSALLGFMFWEMLKVGVAIALLSIAAKVVPNLNWPVLLVTMVVCIKVNWAALLWPVKSTENKVLNQHGS